MSKLKKIFSDETLTRILNLENDMEEFKKNVSEENLRLKTPYTTDKNSDKISFSISSSGGLCVYVQDKLVGEITLNQEE